MQQFCEESDRAGERWECGSGWLSFQTTLNQMQILRAGDVLGHRLSDTVKYNGWAIFSCNAGSNVGKINQEYFSLGAIEISPLREF